MCKYSHLQASLGCSISIPTNEVLFPPSNFSLSGRSHVYKQRAQKRLARDVQVHTFYTHTRRVHAVTDTDYHCQSRSHNFQTSSFNKQYWKSIKRGLCVNTVFIPFPSIAPIMPHPLTPVLPRHSPEDVLTLTLLRKARTCKDF